jgi:hypothetical protein
MTKIGCGLRATPSAHLKDSSKVLQALEIVIFLDTAFHPEFGEDGWE